MRDHPEVVAPTLAKLAAELDAVLTERHDEIVRAVARILVAMAVEEHHGPSPNPARSPRL